MDINKGNMLIRFEMVRRGYYLAVLMQDGKVVSYLKMDKSELALLELSFTDKGLDVKVLDELVRMYPAGSSLNQAAKIFTDSLMRMYPLDYKSWGLNQG